MTSPLSYRPAAGEIPTEPGVYRFTDDTGRVLYVGKAKNLRARLSNYFQPLHSLHERTRRMVTTATGVTWTVVPSDVQALQLEYTWIKEFDPPFNVKFRDDKSYPFLCVTLGEEAPRVFVTRNTRIRGAKYFGPYPKVWAVNEVLDLMVKAMPIRTCKDSDYKKAMASGKPCFASQIGKCGGPCSQRVTIEQHRVLVDEFVKFMASYDTSVLREYERRMREAAMEQRYEDAAILRDRIGSLEAVLDKSAVVLRDSVDLDLVAVADDELAASVQLFTVRGGRIRGVRGKVVDKEIAMTAGEVVDQAIQTFYGETTEPPREIVVSHLPDDSEALESWLSEHRRGTRVKVFTPKRGEKAALLETAVVNARQSLVQFKTKRAADYVTRSTALGDLQEALGMAEAPLRMECFDVSHLGGTNVVASMVVFEDGLPRKSEYRRYVIEETTDDTDSIRQVMTRRLANLGRRRHEPADVTSDEPVIPEEPKARFAYRPQLIIVDGGQPQVNAAAEAFKAAGVTDIALCGIAKRLEELWLPGEEYPVILPRTSDALFLVQRIRDEAHRFAITHQRTRRKRDIRTMLGEIRGVGEVTANAILKHFGSVTRVREASIDELRAVSGVGPSLAKTIFVALHPNGVDTPNTMQSGDDGPDDVNQSAIDEASASQTAGTE